jgi:predicted AAA+ superfamily ATPase
MYERAQAAELAKRLLEPRRLIQAVAGPRQTGKTTLVRQVLARIRLPHRYATADEPELRGREWLIEQWTASRLQASQNGRRGAVLALDEIQKISGWSETIKRLWDEDSATGMPLRVIILGSAPLLMQRGLGESLAGRFEVLPLFHWSFSEMRQAFGWNIGKYLYFGGYPGSASLIGEPKRWARYIRDALVETTISRDILLLKRVDKPALLRRLFDVGIRYSGQILSYQKMIGQLQDAGNTTTLAHYLELLEAAGIMTGLQKYSGDAARRRGSSPKLQAMNTGLITAFSGLSPKEAERDSQFWGRLVESAVGAHLVNAVAEDGIEVFYWRDRNREVDFVVRSGRRVMIIEVKSGRRREALPGWAAFSAVYKPFRTLLIGGDGIPLETFLSRPVDSWMKELS